MATEPLPEDTIEQELSDLPAWNYEDDKIKAEFEFDDFRQAIAFIVQIAFEAEQRVHHPEIKNVYSTVNIALTTHDAGNKVTEKDLDLARAIQDIGGYQ